jgi:3-oxoacyl-[acyl-carrier protein] reductase
MSRSAALVTGARRGIGKAIALELASAGYDLALTDFVDDESMRETLSACEAQGALVAFHRHDSADVASHDALIDAIFERFGRLDVVVNSAGIGSPVRGDLLDLKPEHFDAVMNVNLRGAVFLCQAAARRMAALKSDAPRAIIVVTSISAEFASPERTDYCISKAGLSMFVKTLALRLAPENIAVFELRPGIIRTDMTEGVAAKHDAAIAGGLVPMRRWGAPEDMARSVAALASGAFHFSTGTVIQADGGLAVPRF